VTDETEAADLIAEAIDRGADPDDAADALALWRKTRAADVTRLYTSDLDASIASHPAGKGPETTAPRCLCGHARSQHTAGKSQCWSAVCGCGSFREPEPAIPARFDERYDPSPEPIDRRIK
jgi:hypothetical protein